MTISMDFNTTIVLVAAVAAALFAFLAWLGIK